MREHNLSSVSIISYLLQVYVPIRFDRSTIRESRNIKYLTGLVSSKYKKLKGSYNIAPRCDNKILVSLSPRE